MRVLALVPLMGAGGAEAVVAALATDIRAHGHEVTVASAGGFRSDLLASAGIDRLDVSLGSRRPVDLARAAVRLRRHCAASPPDLVHAHNVKAAVAARCAVGRSAPVLATVHGVPPQQYRLAARLLVRSTDRVAAVSPYVAGELHRHGYPRERLLVVPNALSPLPRRERTAARRRLGLPTAAPVAVCVARMAVQKRHDLLIEAWADLPDNAVLLLAGDGPTRPAIESAVRSRGLADRIRVLGDRTDVDWLLAAADVAVLPTDWEGLPISVLEAMGAGVPVVVSRVGDVAETLGDAVHTVEPGSAPALAAGLTRLLGSPAERTQIAARGRVLLSDLYQPDRMLERYRALYAELCDGFASTSAPSPRRVS